MSGAGTDRLRVPVSRRWLWGVAALVILGLAAVFRSWWLPGLVNWTVTGPQPDVEQPEHPSGRVADNHRGREHAGHNHDEANSLELSRQARSNIGVKVAQVELQSFERTITIPGMVAERPGRSTVEITAPLTGVVSRIYTIQGEAAEQGQALFDMRLTHEELVQAQGDFLRTAEELDVIQREVGRLEPLAADGGIAGKTLLERRYEQQKQEAVLRAERQALLLHGLSAQQVDKILETRTLLQHLSVAVPPPVDAAASDSGPPIYVVQELRVEQGQHVNAGDTLAVLADHAELFIEGNAFERDIAEIHRAAGEKWHVSAVVEFEGSEPQIVPGLGILFLGGKVDPESRAFHFYVTLPNTLLGDDQTAGGYRFIYWRFKPGQRVQLRVPVARLTKRIVLPVDAIAEDGAETYVFQPNGDRFERRPVHVEHRDPFFVVIANDGSLFPGDAVAMSGAHQMLLALKNKAGGGPDPHAGHHH